MSSCIRGYHIYHHNWESEIGETLICEREPSNVDDRYAVGVKRDGEIVGHLPKKISRVSSLFLLRGGSCCITCTVVGRRRYSADLVQGGLEIPCTILFRGTQKEINKLKTLKTVLGVEQ